MAVGAVDFDVTVEGDDAEDCRGADGGEHVRTVRVHRRRRGDLAAEPELAIRVAGDSAAERARAPRRAAHAYRTVSCRTIP